MLLWLCDRGKEVVGSSDEELWINEGNVVEWDGGAHLGGNALGEVSNFAVDVHHPCTRVMAPLAQREYEPLRFGSMPLRCMLWKRAAERIAWKHQRGCYHNASM